MTVHALHAQKAVVAVGQGRQAHKAASNIAVDFFGHGHDLFRHADARRAAADVDIGPLGLIDQLHRPVDEVVSGLVLGRERHHRLGNIRTFGHLHILGNVNEHGAGAAGFGNLERLPDGVGQLLHIGDKVIVLGDGDGDAGNVDLLEAVPTNQAGGDVAGDGHQGDGIQHGRGDAGDQIGCAGAGRGDDNTHLAGDAGIAVGRMGSALLVGRQHMIDAVACLVQLIVQVQYLTAGVAENVGDALLDQCFHDDLRTRHLPAFCRFQ